MLRKLFIAIAAVLLLAAAAGVACLTTRGPAAIEAGEGDAEPLAWWARKSIQAMFDYRVWSGARSGFVAMFARDGEIVFATRAGWADVERRIPMTLETPMRIASLTKPITAAAAMTLVEDGLLALDDPLAQYLPAAADLRVATRHERNAAGGFDTRPLSSPLLVRHLLMFASGLAGYGTLSGDSDLEKLWQAEGVSGGSGSLAQRVEHALSLPLLEEPGSAWRYGNSADVLARVMEVATGKSFPEILRQRVFEPLGMHDTAHLPPPERRGGLAIVYTQDEDGALVPSPKRVHEVVEWTEGGGGLVSTVRDYMRFGLMMRGGGSLDGVRVLSPESVALMTRPHVESGVLVDQGLDGLGWGLGLSVVVDAEKTPTLDHDGDYWWAGLYGGYWGVSPEADLVAVVLSANEPSPHSDLPIAVHMAMSVARMGM